MFCAFDSNTVELCLALCPWATLHYGKGGSKGLTSETFITNLMSRLVFRRITKTGNLLYGRISSDSNVFKNKLTDGIWPPAFPYRSPEGRFQKQAVVLAHNFFVPFRSLMQTGLQRYCPGTKKPDDLHHPACF